MSAQTEQRDALTGAEIRHHSWDGIQELNNPLPRWWLSVFLACVVWAVGYWIVMPSWPMLSGYSRGVIGWSQRGQVARELATVADSRKQIDARLLAANPADLERQPDLVEYATASARPVFKENCAPCHGAGAQGAIGYPNLNDDDWIWGGALSDIEATITHGIRNEDRASRVSEMPAFLPTGTLTRAQIETVARYVLSLSGGEIDEASKTAGAKIFADQCSSCHGADGRGDRAQGALNLTDKIWLHGGSLAKVVQTISYARNASMPAWNTRLSPATIRALAVYVHTLGGGEPESQSPGGAASAATPAKK